MYRVLGVGSSGEIFRVWDFGCADHDGESEGCAGTMMCGIPSKAHRNAKVRKESYKNSSIIRN